ncbi:MAG: hypothetical protein EPO20_09305 [Betaproteobacteria bacterium]|nr:MAG: hypothetical protein EPO20_09305 [Betaproteobacteria bacterium]
MTRFAVLLLFFPLNCFAQHPHEQEVQRALIELDRRGADFARGTPSQPLEPYVGQPLNADPEIARQLRPYERMKMAETYVLRLPPPVVQKKGEKPLPLPGGPRSGVDPVTPPRLAD